MSILQKELPIANICFYYIIVLWYFCDKDLSDGQSAVVFREKGNSSVNQASEKRGSAISNRVKETINNVGKCLEVQSSLHVRPRNNILNDMVSKIGGKGQNMRNFENHIFGVSNLKLLYGMVYMDI